MGKKIEGGNAEQQQQQQQHPEIINPGRQILASQQLSLFPTSTLTERIETHKIISTPIGVSGTPIILQTAGALTSLQPNASTTTYLTTEGGSVKRIFTAMPTSVAASTVASTITQPLTTHHH